MNEGVGPSNMQEAWDVCTAAVICKQITEIHVITNLECIGVTAKDNMCVETLPSGDSNWPCCKPGVSFPFHELMINSWQTNKK